MQAGDGYIADNLVLCMSSAEVAALEREVEAAAARLEAEQAHAADLMREREILTKLRSQAEGAVHAQVLPHSNAIVLNSQY